MAFRNGRSTSRTRVATAVAVTLAVVGLTACGASDDTTSGGESASDGAQTKIAFFGLAANNTYTQSMYEAAKKRAAEMNASVQFFDGKFDTAVQTRQIQDAITSKRFEGFLVMANDGVGVVPVIKQATAADIKVAGLYAPIGKDPVAMEPQVDELSTQVVEHLIDGAEVMASETVRACKAYEKPCKVGVLWGNRSSPVGAALVPAFKRGLTPDVKVAAEADTDFLSAVGQTKAGDMLQATPDIDVFVTNGDQTVIGAERAIAQAGKELGNEPGKVTIIGHGATDKGVKAVTAGRWFSTYALVPRSAAVRATELLIGEIRGDAIGDGDRSIDQSSLSPFGNNATAETLKAHPDFRGEWTS